MADFYRGKTLRMRVGLAAGGGYDLYTRAVARHIGNHMPGSPAVVVENVTGAGGAALAADTYNRGAKDGTEISVFPGALFLQRLLGQSDLSFEASGWGFVGATDLLEYICTTHERSGISDWKQLTGPNARQAALGAAAGFGETINVIVQATTKANIKMVTGYAGTAPMRLAMEQGELDGTCNTDWTSVLTTSLDDLTTGKQKVVLQLSSTKKQGVPQGDAPTIYEFLTSDEDRAVVKYGIEDPGIYGRPFVSPPGVPAARLAALRQAFNETMADPDFQADAARSNLSISPISGRELEQLISAGQQMPDAVKARLRTYYKIP